MTTNNPNERDQIPDERTEEEELEHELAYWGTEVDSAFAKVRGIRVKLAKIRKENAAFLKDYAPDAIGSDPEDGL